MFETLFAHTAQWMDAHLPLAMLTALAWGLGSVIFSPCHLAAIPVMAVHAAGYPLLHGEEGETPLPGPQVTVFFALGYFCAIALLGGVCGLLGRVVDLEAAGGEFWLVPAGLALVWFGVSLWREHSCSSAGDTLRRWGARLGLRARQGATVLGAGYGLVSSGCTLAFLTPLMVLSLPQGPLVCLLMAAAFGLGHCLPMALVGLVPALTRRLLHTCRIVLHLPLGHERHHDGPHAHPHEGEEHHAAEQRFRKVAAVALVLAGLVLALHPFFE